MLVLVLVAGLDAAAKSKKKAKEIDSDLVVTGDAIIDGSLAVNGDLDVAGNSSTLGTRTDTYGLGNFYLNSGVDGVRWRLNRDAGWLWEKDVAGSTSPVMRLDEANRLFLYDGGQSRVVLDPAGRSISLGDVSLIRSEPGVLQTNASLTAANLSGINTGDQTRADLNLGRNDTVKFGRVKVSGAVANERVFVADDLETDGKDFVILADGTHQWRQGNDHTANLYRSAQGTLQTDGVFVVGSGENSTSPATGALMVAGGVGVAGDLHVGGSVVTTSLQSPTLNMAARSVGDPEPNGIRFLDDTESDWAGIMAIASLGAFDESALVFSTRTTGGDLVEQIRITGSGKIGVGTTDPEYGLDVAGELRITGPGDSVIQGPLLLIPQGDLPMGEFTEGPDPNEL
jgi:hypothetical protein